MKVTKSLRRNLAETDSKLRNLRAAFVRKTKETSEATKPTVEGLSDQASESPVVPPVVASTPKKDDEKNRDSLDEYIDEIVDNLDDGDSGGRTNVSTGDADREEDGSGLEDKEQEVDELTDTSDESFNHPPDSLVANEVVEVRNFVFRRPSFIIPKGEGSVEKTITTLNNSICFTAVGESSKTTHNFGNHGKMTCALYPYCEVVFEGGEELGKVIVHEPETHHNFEKEAWGCLAHCRANLDGVRAQTQTMMQRPARRTRKKGGKAQQK